MLDLLLVNPNAKATYGPLSELSALEPPLWCALLAAYSRQEGFRVGVIDAEAENLTVAETVHRIIGLDPVLCAEIVLGINPSVSSTPKMTVAAAVLKELRSRAPKIRTVLSGLHPSALPERTLEEVKECDYVVQGEGFKALSALAADRESAPGVWSRTGPHPEKAELLDLNLLPRAAWDLLPMSKYRSHNWQCLGSPENRSPYAAIYTSLGCVYQCSYCNIHAMYGKTGIRYRSPDLVAEEVDYLVKNYSVHTFRFLDEMFTVNPEHTKSVCEAVAGLGYDLNIWTYARADTLNSSLLSCMKEAGIRWVCIGFESAVEQVRKGAAKRYSQKEIERVTQECKEAGVHIIANFMVGLSEDTKETMEASLEEAKRMNFEYLNLYACAPYPGSQLFEEAVKRGVNLPKQWADWSQFSPDFEPSPTKHLSSQQVLQFRDRAFREYFDRYEYLDMIEVQFGAKAKEQIENMLKVDLVRRKQ